MTTNEKKDTTAKDVDSDLTGDIVLDSEVTDDLDFDFGNWDDNDDDGDNTSVEDILEDKPKQVQVKTEDDDDDDDLDDDDDEDLLEETEVENGKDTSSKKSRAAERIQELNTKAKQKETEAAQAAILALSEREEKLTVQKEMSERFVGQMEEDLKEIQALINTFTELGHTDKVALYQQKYMDRKAEVAVTKPQVEKLAKDITEHKQKIQEAKKSFETGAYKNGVQDSGKSAAAEWDRKNPWFSAPITESEKQKKELTSNVFSRMRNEGFDLNDPETYKELDKRVARYSKTMVNSNSNDKSSGKGEDSQTEKKKAAPSQSKDRSTVLGKSSSYTQGISVDSDKRTVRISLTESEKDTARQLGISEKEYAIEKIRLAKQRKGL